MAEVSRDLIISTRKEKVDKIRKMILELLLAHASVFRDLTVLAEVYGTFYSWEPAVGE